MGKYPSGAAGTQPNKFVQRLRQSRRTTDWSTEGGCETDRGTRRDKLASGKIVVENACLAEQGTEKGACATRSARS